MKKLTLLYALLIFCFSSFSQEVLDNQSVIDMVELGFDEQVIIDKIESTNSNFSTSIEKLKSLKLLGVTQNILSIMIKESKVKIPLDGEYIEYHSNGNVKSKVNYVDGKKQGEYLEYWELGRVLYIKANYEDGKLQGEYLEYHSNRNVNIRANYVDGKLQGEYLDYYYDGDFQLRKNYVDGKLQGQYLEYWGNGDFKIRKNYEDGKLQGEYLEYWNNGKLKSKANYVDGKQESMSLHYDIDGNKL